MKNYLCKILLIFGGIIAWQSTQAQFVPPRILKHPSQIRTERLNILNTIYRETNLNVSPDGKYLYFMSGRGGQPWSPAIPRTIYRGRPEFDGDIYYSVKVGGRWQNPRCLDARVNTSNGEDEPNISPDGQTVYFQSWAFSWETRGGPYYMSSRNGASWTNPQGLGGGITKFFQDMSNREPKGWVATDGATMSADGKTFIVAAGKYYDRNMDLYISRKNEYGYWSYPRRLPVSTLGDERSPFLASDGKTLYFASDGLAGWGGLDIFKTILNDNGSKGEVVNVGAPFNTWQDDYCLILTASGDEAYFVREGDIYFADTKEASPELKPFNATLMLSGIITSSKTKKGTLAKIIIRDPQTGKVITQGKSNGYTGEYGILLPIEADNFIQEVSKVGYEGFKKDFQVEIKTGLNQVVSNVELKAPEIKEPIDARVTVDPKPKEEEAAAATGSEEGSLKEKD